MPAMLPFSLEALRSHAIFIPPASSSAGSWELVDKDFSDDMPASQKARMAMRDKDLFVAFGKEVRMTSLAGEGWEVLGGTVGGYKTLRSPHLTFTINQLVINPTGRLLAVVGHHQLVILVLPRGGFASSTSGEVSCRSFPVDEYQHSPSSTNVITRVRWHTWGEGGNSLWVLTADGRLFEYDVLQPHDALQTFNFLPDTGVKRPKSKFSAVDPLSQYATSFAFSTGTLDFSPLMVYGLMANGDVYSIGPVLPFHAEIPADYIASLLAWVGERSKRLKKRSEAASSPGQEGSAEHAAVVGRVALQLGWVEHLAKQATGHEDDQTLKTSKRRGFGLRDPSPSRASSDRTPPPPGFVHVHPPHLTAMGGPAPGMHRPLMRQGPLLIDPAPQEVGNGVDVDEQSATDIVVIRAADESDSKSEERVNVVAIAWSGGRVDLCIEEEAPEPRWITSRDPAPTVAVLALVESVLASFPNSEADAIQSNAPHFVLDPMYSDVLYVAHTFGVDAVSVAPWVGKLLAGAAELPPSDVACLVKTDSSHPVVGCVTFCNLTLGYGLLAMAATGQLAAVEMDSRIALDSRTSGHSQTSQESTEQATDIKSLLTNPFPSTTIKPADPAAAVRKLPDGRKALQSIGPDHLRALATASADIGPRIQSVRTAAESVEDRLDLQVAEYARQLKTLRDAASSVEGIRTGAKRNAERTEAMANAQTSLVERLDTVLNAMLAEYRPQIGEVERKWFDELERVRQRVQGYRRTAGLAQQAKVLKEQLEVVKSLAPTQEDVAEAEYGQRQLRPLQAALGARSNELARMMRKLEALSIKVEEGAKEE